MAHAAETISARRLCTPEQWVRSSGTSHRKNFDNARGSSSQAIAESDFRCNPRGFYACGFKLANDGQDTRAIQSFLGHKNIQHTVRYTELAPNRFKNFWRD